MADEKLGKTMLESVFYSLNVLGYPHHIIMEDVSKMIDPNSGSLKNYSTCISWLSRELKSLCNLEECVSPIDDADDEESFRMELSSFLRELRCPYPAIPRSTSIEFDSNQRLELLYYLCTELQAVRISHGAKRVETQKSVDTTSSPSNHLNAAALALGVSEDFLDHQTALDLVKIIIEKVQQRLQVSPNVNLGEPLWREELNGDQWRLIESLNNDMKVDYRNRADLLLQRLDVTIQSFSWSERLKDKKDEIKNLFVPLRQKLERESKITMADFVAARTDLTLVEKASSSNLCLAKFHKTMLSGDVPDRGGRPKDVTRMPQWKERVVNLGGGPQRERGHKKKGKDNKKKPWKEDGDASGPSGSVSMTKRSRKKGKRGSDAGDADGTVVADASQLFD